MLKDVIHFVRVYIKNNEILSDVKNKRVFTY